MTAKKKPIISSLQSMIFFLAIFGSCALACFAFAWTDPDSPPPSSIIPLPINIGPADQTKLGNLSIGSGLSYWITKNGDNFALVNDAGATQLLLSQDGNLGLGTSNLDAKLNINGQIKIAGGSPGAGKVLVSDASGLATWQNVTGGLPAGSNNQTLRHNGSSWVTNTLLYNTGTNIGIGINPPTAKLQIYESQPSGIPLLNVSSGNSSTYYSVGTGKITLRTANAENATAGSIDLVGGGACGSSAVGGSINLVGGGEAYSCAGESGGSVNITAGNGDPTSGIGGSIILTPGNTGCGGTPGKVIMNRKVGINTNTPDVALDVSGDIEGSLTSTGSTVAVYAVAGGGNGGTYKLVRFSSSKRYKDNITDLDLGLETLSKLRPVEFTWKSTGERDFGFIAEEAEAVNPKLVTYTNGQVESFRYAQLGAILTNAVKEQDEEIKTLEKEIEARKSEIELLKQELK